MFDGETPVATVPEELPAEIAAALNAKRNEFKPAPRPRFPNGKAQEDAARIAAPRTASPTHRGGPFALQFKSRLIDIENEGVVRFAYRIEPGAMIDFTSSACATANFNPRHQNCYRWRLNGRRKTTPAR